MNTVAELGKQFRHRRIDFAIGGCRGPRQQMVGRGHQRRDLGAVRLQLDAPREAPADRDALQLLGKVPDTVQRAALKKEQHEQHARYQCEQEAQKPEDRHKKIQRLEG